MRGLHMFGFFGPKMLFKQRFCSVCRVVLSDKEKLSKCRKCLRKAR